MVWWRSTDQFEVDRWPGIHTPDHTHKIKEPLSVQPKKLIVAVHAARMFTSDLMVIYRMSVFCPSKCIVWFGGDGDMCDKQHCTPSLTSGHLWPHHIPKLLMDNLYVIFFCTIFIHALHPLGVCVWCVVCEWVALHSLCAVECIMKLYCRFYKMVNCTSFLVGKRCYGGGGHCRIVFFFYYYFCYPLSVSVVLLITMPTPGHLAHLNKWQYCFLLPLFALCNRRWVCICIVHISMHGKLIV